MTRARDRLYLGSVLKEGRLQPGRGSLAEVLPHTLIELFAGPGGECEWRASSGAVHRFRRCEPANREPANLEPTNLEPPDPGSRIPDPGLVPLVDSAPLRASVASLISAGDETMRRLAPLSDRLVGTLVHRLLQRIGFSALASDAVRDLAARLVRPGDIDDGEDLEEMLDAAAASYASICAHGEVQVLYSAGRRLHEVPFTMAVERRVLRGTVDCLVETAPDRLTVLEFKTGPRRPEHQAQLELYLQAMQQVFPNASIDTLLIYADAHSSAI